MARRSQLKFELQQHPDFDDALLDMLEDPAMVADGDRLLFQLEKFVANKDRHGQLLRDNGSIRAYYVGDKYSALEVPSAFAIVIEESDVVIDARLHVSKGLNSAKWRALYSKVILRVEQILGI